jgi:filamentous hemagglutinin family protein
LGQIALQYWANTRARRKSALLRACAFAALATSPAIAAASLPTGAFQGRVIGTSGVVSRNPTSNTTETITVGSPTVTLNWTPNDTAQGGGAIDFLPNGNVATFTGASGLTDYTVLNRIVPTDATRAISLDGQVISTLQDTGATGGRVWFYSPGGIVIGATAVFDVGSLLLTTNSPSTGGSGRNISAIGTDFSLTFTGPASSTSKIQIMPGAQINALQPGSYVALVAPRIEQGGTVRVNGSAAYAAGEQVTLTMNQGLFDIQVDAGTTDPNGVVHTGETSGPANSIAGDNHNITMVAVPKNQALTMLLGGTIGFDAASADVQNGKVI